MSLHRRIRCPRPMAGSRHRCHHQSPPQSTTLAPHHRHPSRRRHRHRRDPIPGDTQAWLDAVHDARQRHWMSRVGELCARSTREVRSAAPGPYGGTSPNGCCFGFCPSSMIYVREREVPCPPGGGCSRQCRTRRAAVPLVAAGTALQTRHRQFLACSR